MAFSPDGHRLATASDDGTVRLWDADTGQPIGDPLTGHTDAVTSVAFSPDGHRLASASADSTVRLWDADTGQPIGDPLTGHTGAVNSVAFSPDGHRLASGQRRRHSAAVAGLRRPRTMLCAKLTTNMSHQQWRDWVSPDIDYIAGLPGPAGPAGLARALVGLRMRFDLGRKVFKASLGARHDGGLGWAASRCLPGWG